MQRHKRAVLVLASLALVAAVASAAHICATGEFPASHFNTYADARAAGALGPSGWIPAWIPESAYDIQEQHAIDSLSRCIRFSLPEDEARHLRQVLAPLEPQKVTSLDASCRFGASWWFEGLIQQQPANDNALNAELFQGFAGDAPVLVAIDRVLPQVFIWSR